VCFLFSSLCAFGLSPANAADPIDTLSEISEKLKTKLQNLTEMKKEEESIVSKMKNINNKISNKEKELNQYNKRISQTRSKINNVSKEINSINDKLDSSQQYLEEHIVALYKRQYNNDAMMLISADNYNDLIKKSRYISLVAYHNNAVLNEYKDKLNKVNSQKEKLESLQSKLNTNKKEIRNKTNRFKADLARKDEILAEVRVRRVAHEKKIKDLKTSSREIMDMVNKLKTKEMPESILGKGFRSLKGQLPWPVDGAVVGSFGKYKDPEFNIAGFRNGIEIKAGSGDAAQAIAGGRVVYINKFKGYGNMLIIDHGNGYHSLYGNLSEMSLEKGNLLVNGMNVGRITKSGKSDDHVLYFEIRYRGKPIDPMDWLEKTRLARSFSR
jgi:septal ring factor EnvC (AmiA/AmiB activator)